MDINSSAAASAPEPPKTIISRRPLYLSIAAIVVAWLITAVRNIFFSDSIRSAFDEMPRFFVQALIVGLLTIGVVSLLLRLSQETYHDIGFRTEKLLRQFGIGILFGLLIFIAGTFVTRPLADTLVGEQSAGGVDMGKLFADINTLPIWMLVSLFKGGLCEELWRVFTMIRFEKLAGRPGLIAALILNMGFFGVGHLYQGLGGAISIASIGLFNALVYLRKRSAIEAVTAHATFDLISISLGFMLYAGK